LIELKNPYLKNGRGFFKIMISKEQIAEEERKEKEYNKLFEMVISKSPFGQWYGLMIGASNLLTKNLPKRVGIDKDGRPIIVYKTEMGKIMGVWANPTHKVIAKNLGQKKYGTAVGALLGTGQITEMIKQKRAKFFDISPSEVTEINNRREALKNKKTEPTKPVDVTANENLRVKETNTVTIEQKKVDKKPDEKNYTPIIILSLLSIASVIAIIKYRKG
jgi:hypothetical protein